MTLWGLLFTWLVPLLPELGFELVVIGLIAALRSKVEFEKTPLSIDELEVSYVIGCSTFFDFLELQLPAVNQIPRPALDQHGATCCFTRLGIPH